MRGAGARSREEEEEEEEEEIRNTTFIGKWICNRFILNCAIRSIELELNAENS